MLRVLSSMRWFSYATTSCNSWPRIAKIRIIVHEGTQNRRIVRGDASACDTRATSSDADPAYPAHRFAAPRRCDQTASINTPAIIKANVPGSGTGANTLNLTDPN